MANFIKETLDAVRETGPLVHNITNYVTVNDCANALLAIGASPIMSDEPLDVEDITSICGGLTINIGTLNERSIAAMELSGKRSNELGHPVILDPVGAGASALRTQTAARLLDELEIAVVRGNMSEIKALASGSTTTRGVDVCPDDVVSKENLEAGVAFAKEFARRSSAVVAITGQYDIVADETRALVISNGSAFQGQITGAGCMLSCMCAAFAVANPERILEGVVGSVAAMGLAGQIAEKKLAKDEGNGSFRTYLLDALYLLDGDTLAEGALIEQV